MSPAGRKESINDAKQVARILNCLASPARLMIICSLIDGEKNVTQFAEILGTTMGNISQHLRMLESNGIIEGRREGNKVYYRIISRDVVRLIKEIKKICKNVQMG